MFLALLQLIFLIASPLVFVAIGRFIFDLAAKGAARVTGRIFAASEQFEEELPFFVLGLLVYLILVFLLRTVHVPWLAAVLLPCLAGYPRFYVAALGLRRRAVAVLSLNFVLWTAIVAALGLSLFNVKEGIVTPWVNNYGDLTFHIGMITSFVFGDNIPPQYHLYPGDTLSYPFLMNLWSATFWSIQPVFRTLALIFAFQWLVVWTGVFCSLNGNRFRLAPWALLFAGGSYDYLFNCAAGMDRTAQACIDGAHTLIGKGYPWTPFITTIWVTQRPALFGLLAVLPALRLFHSWFKMEDRNGAVGSSTLLIAGLLLGLSPLAHFHLFLAAALYIGLTLTIEVGIRLFKERGKNWREASLSLGSFGVPLCLSFLFLPWLLGKTSMVKTTAGWMPWPLEPDQSFFLALFRSVSMWLNNAPNWLLFVLAAFLLARRRTPLIAFALLFLFGNFVQLAVWEWDQLKFFIGLYLISLSLLQLYEKKDYPILLSILLFFLIVPAVYETGKVMVKFEEFTVYTKQEMQLAGAIRRTTPTDAIIAAKPDHNSLVTLTGRKLYAGYDGTLGSHGIDYQARYNMQHDLEKVLHCSVEQFQVCPGYILWTDREKAYWAREEPGSSLAVPVIGGHLYKIGGDAGPAAR